MDLERLEEHRPPPYRVADTKHWIICDEPDIAGLAILVRVSITNAEQRALRQRMDQLTGPYTEAWNAQAPEERDLAESPWARQKSLLAPYVLDWNATGTLLDGGEGPIPAPAVTGPDAFECVSNREVFWVVDVVLGGYLVTGKAGPSPPPSGPTGDTPEPAPGDQPTPTRKSRTRRRS